MSLIMGVNLVAVVLTALLLKGLLYQYVGLLRQTPSRFTWGLTLFAVALWFQAAVQVYFFATRMALYVGGLEGVILAQNLLSLVASAVLLTVTVRPVGMRQARADVVS